ncbi:UDP-N-acetylmuramate dehydrogenase [Sulfidibacter corallicola]|uniref:UDP-N-acetylenolpyruvoylglucosamine reductase n=1 Tax=Sulfidibacter corallicola TaxID=2818388 RepID=A0A8A4TM62_SULCO|nr:UDP-N-acetylmuramate dehydrogenase [Sulfidibacter corallicola]QTD47685.1 UDP-N-acetylmuramate dehydrogenase [Sulfidibacter corallicola]
MNLRENVPLAPLTTLGIGGPARYFGQARTTTDLVEMITWARNHRLPFFLLGGGSNLVFDDTGFPGLVIALAMKGIEYRQNNQNRDVEVTAAAGELWDDFVAEAVARNLAGIECLSGIPGLVGAAPIQNIGAYGQEVSQTITEVEILNLETMQVESWDNARCAFAYRDSVFKGAWRDRAVVLSVRFNLRRNGKATVTYPDLTKRLPKDASVAKARAAVLIVRGEKSMLADPTDPNARSCGSFFTNPILDPEAYAAFQTRCREPHPAYAQDDGRVKLSAAWLIDHSGFKKGLVRGGVGLSQKHCLALINRGSGSSAEVIALKNEIQDGVLQRFGVRLEPEPLILAGREKP